MFEGVNGVLFPGGDASLDHTNFWRVASFFYNNSILVITFPFSSFSLYSPFTFPSLFILPFLSLHFSFLFILYSPFTFPSLSLYSLFTFPFSSLSLHFPFHFPFSLLSLSFLFTFPSLFTLPSLSLYPPFTLPSLFLFLLISFLVSPYFFVLWIKKRVTVEREKFFLCWGIVWVSNFFVF